MQPPTQISSKSPKNQLLCPDYELLISSRFRGGINAYTKNEASCMRLPILNMRNLNSLCQTYIKVVC